jgi:hypothetical protein
MINGFTNVSPIDTNDTVVDNDRTNNNRIDSELGPNCDENRNDEFSVSKYAKTNNLSIVIYRFKFTEEFMGNLYNFSKIHQYDDRITFKEAWIVWTDENDIMIDEEIRRLTNLGYNGDVLDKMFKSARYYFRKKSTEKKEPIQRRQYISVNKELLDAMDIHIEENIADKNYQPKTGFTTFCNDNAKILKETIAKVFEQGIKDPKLIEDKIKKTYKNRYFNFIILQKQVKTG